MISINTENTIVQVASGRFGVHKDYLENSAAIEIKIGRARSRVSAGTCWAPKLSGEISKHA